MFLCDAQAARLMQSAGKSRVSLPFCIYVKPKEVHVTCDQTAIVAAVARFTEVKIIMCSRTQDGNVTSILFITSVESRKNTFVLINLHRDERRR